MKPISIHRVYNYKVTDGTYRVLVDRLWPRGIKKIDLSLDEWNKEIAPSNELRIWFDHKAELFDEFALLYREELMVMDKELNRLRTIAKTQPIDLLFGAKDMKINHAAVLRDILLEGM